MTARDRKVLLVVLAAAAIAGFWFLVFSPKRDQAAKLGTQIAAAKREEASARQDIAAGLAARSQYGRNYSLIARLGEAVPTDDNEPSLVFQLDSAARRSGVDFRSLKLQAAPNGSATAAGAKSAPATQAASATLPPGAAVGPAGFPTMPFALSFDGDFFRMSDFFRRLDGFVQLNSGNVAVGGRLLTINGLSLTASRRGFPAVKATVSANAYLASPTPAPPAGAAPAAGPAAAGAAKPAAGPGPATSAAPATVAPPR